MGKIRIRHRHRHLKRVIRLPKAAERQRRVRVVIRLVRVVVLRVRVVIRLVRVVVLRVRVAIRLVRVVVLRVRVAARLVRVVVLRVRVAARPVRVVRLPEEIPTPTPNELSVSPRLKSSDRHIYGWPAVSRAEVGLFVAGSAGDSGRDVSITAFARRRCLDQRSVFVRRQLVRALDVRPDALRAIEGCRQGETT